MNKKENLNRSRLTHKGIIAGKLKGQIPAQTPRGSLILYVSMPFDTLDTYSPICRVAMPHACSTTSSRKNPKKDKNLTINRIKGNKEFRKYTSRRYYLAHGKHLLVHPSVFSPVLWLCSKQAYPAEESYQWRSNTSIAGAKYLGEINSLTVFLRIRSCSLNMIRCLAVIGVCLQDRNASLAADTADLNSTFVVNGTRETTSCVAYDKNIYKSNSKIYNNANWNSIQNQVKLRIKSINYSLDYRHQWYPKNSSVRSYHR